MRDPSAGRRALPELLESEGMMGETRYGGGPDNTAKLSSPSGLWPGPEPTKPRFYVDPGHGWLAVPVGDVARAGVLREISSCSYHDRQTALLYLEEDCDAPRYSEAVGLDPSSVPEEVWDRDCFIRRLPHVDGPALANELGLASPQ